MAERARRFGGHIDLAFLQSLDQLVGRQIDDFDLSIVEHAVGHGFAHTNTSEARDDVVQAFDVLDVERGEHIDAGIEQLHHVLPAFGVATARRIAVRKLVDQRQGGAAGKHRIDIHLVQRVALIGHGAARDDLERRDQRLGFGPAMRFDDRNHDIAARPQPLGTLPQHFEGLADAGGSAQENLQPAACLARGLLQQRIGGGALVAQRKSPIIAGTVARRTADSKPTL